MEAPGSFLGFTSREESLKVSFFMEVPLLRCFFESFFKVHYSGFLIFLKLVLFSLLFLYLANKG